MRLPTVLADMGSSPLARGGLTAGVADAADVGLIPAGAGRTPHRPRRRHDDPAHPRWRGADPQDRRRRIPLRGSSPLARGGPTDAPANVGWGRLIPAGAGRTTGPVRQRHMRRAHPRWRGADSDPTTDPAAEMGSSPLARGGPTCGEGAARDDGLIPAGAGRTPRDALRR